MAQKRPSKKTEWNCIYVDAQLTEEQKRALGKDLEFKDAWFLHMDIIEAEHCSLKISYDWYNGCAKASLTADGDEKATFMKCFTMRGATGSSAMIKLLYWFVKVQDGVLPDVRERSKIEDDSFLYD
jgi:hypothetical protein